MGLSCTPPGSFQRVVGIVDPIWANHAIAIAEKFNGSRTEGTPAACIFCFLLWSYQGLAYQRRPNTFRIAIPSICEVAKGCPGVFSRADLCICPCHSVNGFR